MDKIVLISNGDIKVTVNYKKLCEHFKVPQSLLEDEIIELETFIPAVNDYHLANDTKVPEVVVNDLAVNLYFNQRIAASTIFFKYTPETKGVFVQVPLSDRVTLISQHPCD